MTANARPLTDRAQEALGRIFSIDLRALAAFRVGIGAVLVVDLANRARDLVAHYTDAGALPRAALEGGRPSIHALSGGLEWQAALFALAAVAAVCVAVGYRTRWAAVAAWVLTLSLYHRNPYVNNSGDAILLLLLLWGCLLPLGSWASLDARRRGATRTGPVFNLATAGVLLQIYAVYLVSVFHKTGPTWRTEFSAVYYALNLDAFATPLGRSLLDLPYPLLQALTASTLLLEALGPLVAMSPVRSGPLRTAVALAFMSFHAGLAATLSLGVFPFVCIAAWALVLPTWFWDRAEAFVAGGRSRLRAAAALPTPRPRALEMAPFASGAAAAVVLASGLVGWRDYDRAMTDAVSRRGFEVLDRTATAVGLRQNWSMFSPNPTWTDPWFEVTATTADGRRLSLPDAGPYRPATAEGASAWFGSQRWRKWFVGHYQSDRFEPLRAHYVSHLWSEWGRRRPDEPLRSIEVAVVREPTPAWGERSDTTRVVLARYAGTPAEGAEFAGPVPVLDPSVLDTP